MLNLIEKRIMVIAIFILSIINILRSLKRKFNIVKVGYKNIKGLNFECSSLDIVGLNFRLSKYPHPLFLI
jgi:hypothetical protein